MSSQPHAPQLGHHDGHHQHGHQHHRGNHHHGRHGHFDHVLAGLRHQEVTHRGKINRLKQEGEEVEVRRAALLREFHGHADIHEIDYDHHAGHEDKAYPVESQMETARHYFWGMVGGTLVAVAVGAYFRGRHRHQLQREAAAEDQLANKHVDLPAVEHRTGEHEEAHDAEHHGSTHHDAGHHDDAARHAEAAHPESHHATVAH